MCRLTDLLILFFVHILCEGLIKTLTGGIAVVFPTGAPFAIWSQLLCSLSHGSHIFTTVCCRNKVLILSAFTFCLDATSTFRLFTAAWCPWLQISCPSQSSCLGASMADDFRHMWTFWQAFLLRVQLNELMYVDMTFVSLSAALSSWYLYRLWNICLIWVHLFPLDSLVIIFVFISFFFIFGGSLSHNMLYFNDCDSLVGHHLWVGFEVIQWCPRTRLNSLFLGRTLPSGNRFHSIPVSVPVLSLQQFCGCCTYHINYGTHITILVTELRCPLICMGILPESVHHIYT